MLLITSESPSFLPLFNKTQLNQLSVTHAYTSICNVSDAKKDVARSNVHQAAYDVRKILKNVTKGGFLCHALLPCDLLQNKTQFISVACIGMLR